MKRVKKQAQRFEENVLRRIREWEERGLYVRKVIVQLNQLHLKVQITRLRNNFMDDSKDVARFQKDLEFELARVWLAGRFDRYFFELDLTRGVLDMKSQLWPVANYPHQFLDAIIRYNDGVETKISGYWYDDLDWHEHAKLNPDGLNMVVNTSDAVAKLNLAEQERWLEERRLRGLAAEVIKGKEVIVPPEEEP